MQHLPIPIHMPLWRLSFPLAALAACAMSVARAHADVLTMGSDLNAAASIIQAHQADAAFWPTTVQGANPSVPADGQVTSIKLKGTAIRPDGAPPPLNEFHFQTMDRGIGDVMTVYLSSAPFDVPYTGDPNQITTYTPENLCIHKGGVLDFNDEGGWDSTSDGPYRLGTPFRIFGRVANSATNWYSADNGTNNGARLAPPNALGGTELLMQYTLATGNDRSYECGGPLRDPNGQIHHDPPPDTSPKMRYIVPQQPYVQSNGKLAVGVYCHGSAGCAGTAALSIKGKTIASAPFAIPMNKSFRIPMRISSAVYRKLRNAKGRRLPVLLTLNAGALGIFTANIVIRH